MDESTLRSALASVNDYSSLLHRELLAWTFLVALGVALEIVFVVWEYAEDLHDFRRGIVHAPDRPNLLLFVLGFVGAALVAVGVSGELYAESKISTLETCIRAGNDALSLLLSREAGDAAKSAQKAYQLGTDLAEKYQAAEQDLIKLKAEKLPRRLSSSQKSALRNKVEAFAVKTISLACVTSNATGGKEALDFELDFRDAFSSTPAVLQIESYLSSCSLFMMPGLAMPPIQIEYGTQREGDALILVKAIEEIGVKKSDIATKPNANDLLLVLTIGPKP